MIISNAQRKIKQDISMSKKKIAMFQNMVKREQKLLGILEENLEMQGKIEKMEGGLI